MDFDKKIPKTQPSLSNLCNFSSQFFDMNKKVILMILDGWGITQDPSVSAVDHANTPFVDSLYTKFPHAQLRTDGEHVGLPEGQMGNSEVGHMNLGAGRIVYQNLAKINIGPNSPSERAQAKVNPATTPRHACGKATDEKA